MAWLPRQVPRYPVEACLFEGLHSTVTQQLFGAFDEAPVRSDGQALRLQHHAVLAAAFFFLWYGDSLLSGFAVLAGLLLGAALVLPAIRKPALLK